MEKNGLKGLLSHLLESGEDHPDNPEEDDIVTGYENVGGIEIFKVFGLLGPSEGLKGPEC